MRNQRFALLLFTGCPLMICLLTFTSSGWSGFFASRTLFNRRDGFPAWDEGGKRSAPVNFSDAHTFDLNRTLSAPSLDYERMRRRVERGLEEIWNYISSQLQNLPNSVKDKNITARIDQILELGGEQHRSIVADIYNLSQVDGFSSWRQSRLKELSNLVQRRLFYLQNPKNCSSAKKIVCNFKVECGFGCQVHHLSYCMIMAYGTGRTLILHSKGWSYAKEGWEMFFLPLSETCLDDNGKTKANWGDPNSDEKVQVLQIPIVSRLPKETHPDFLPLAIPEDISQELMRAHGNPAVWWIGQIMKFIMRLQPDVSEYIDKMAAALKFEHPIVGIHVRRTDKLRREAKFHGIEEYMVHAEDFYKMLEMRQEVPVRRIYLATDETNLLEEARKEYPNYVFVSDSAITDSAKLSSRFTVSSLKGFLVDLHMLTRSDFLVCTFSSNVGRLAYEMMQDRYEDASDRAFSVDKGYFYHGQNDHEVTALYEHKPRSSEEIELSPGDTVILRHELDDDRNLMKGYYLGINPRLHGKRKGLFPTHKVKDKIRIAKMPTYHETTNFN